MADHFPGTVPRLQFALACTGGVMGESLLLNDGGGAAVSGVGVGVSVTRSWGYLLRNVTFFVIVLVSPFAIQ